MSTNQIKLNTNKKASSAEADKANNLGRETEFESATFRATICRQNDITSNNTNKLSDNTNSEVTKSCLNRVENDQNITKQAEKSDSVAKAVLAINKLPLSPEDKAKMIKLLMNS